MEDKKIKQKPKKEQNKNSSKQNDTFKYIIYGILIVIGIFLILALSLKIANKESDQHYTYNGFEFVKVGNMYQTQILIRGQEENLYNLEFRYGPKDLEDVPVIGEPKLFLRADAMYAVFDPYDYNLSSIGIATGDIQMNLARVLNKQIVAACTKNHTDCLNVSIKNCTNTKAPVIFVRHDPVTLVEQRDNCLIVQGPGMDVTRAANRLIYYLYGIMH